MKYRENSIGFKIIFFTLCLVVFAVVNCSRVYSLPVINRIYGDNRYETSIKISEQNWDRADNVILVDGKGYADALCSAPLSKQLNAPIILINNEISDDVKSELVRLNAKKAYIIGGTGVISSKVETQLKDINIKYERIYGANRYETSIEIAKKLGLSKNVFVVSGNNFPDALSVASTAGIKDMPIILVGNKLNEVTSDFIEKNDIDKAYIIGGPNVVSEDIEKKFNKSERIYGEDRYSTNYKVISKFFEDEFDNVYIADGLNFPDALSGAGAAIKSESPIVLAGKNVNKDIVSYVKSNINTNSFINVLGGTSIISTTSAKLFSNEYTVCIDAGDGGRDTGVKAPNGILEKDINLKVALQLGNILKENGINVVYTRTTDKTLSDEERANIANLNDSDLLVSIHCNSFSNSSANGIETLYQNGSDVSKNLSNLIQENLIKITASVDRKAKTDTTHNLLKETYSPSSMVMIGFLSNTKERELLLNSDYQEKCASGIAQGIKEYIKEYGNLNKKIHSFKDIYETIDKGEEYKLPSTVTALMDDGSYEELNVEWNTTHVDTTKEGKFEYIGSINGCNKKIMLYLTIRDSSSDLGNSSDTPIICIDPGHGGYDPGAIGSGAQEKDITLKIGLKLGKILSDNGIKVVYTRTSDAVPWPPSEREDLQARCDIARENNADYFISIHCNSAVPTAHGIETYYSHLNNANNVSKELAQYVQEELIKEVSAVDRGVKDNVFYVNRNVDCPSILIETGFITNAKEGQLLKSDAYQSKIAHAIAQGILNYLK